ncbi:DUF803 domain protein [Aspergillus candidus]|uniref:DUF803 domain protein n=1 Tax=Aspergillus candidus TaxID=41067 RepID=A0A2I2FD67_ASPCN|nr:hypothetical protein BDW47DRAFT_104519 [Aspergillus candidus]PLB38591.1 hypothetical protein BDW47DRAFT_104519 [Aspergillus candidus]
MGNLGGLSPEGSVAVGVLVGLISTSLQAIGLTLQRKSHILEDEKHPYDIRRPPYKRRRWQVGMGMFVGSNIVGSTIQITTLPLPVLSTLQASGLVFNTIFATLILGESFTRYSLIGTVLVCIGAILIAAFGAIGEPAHSLDQLLDLLQRRSFILWMVGTMVIVLVIFAASKLLKYLTSPYFRSKHPSLRSSYVPYLQLSPPRVRLIRGLSYGSISGILSAHSLLLAKSAVELLVRTIVDRVNQFNRWQSWAILIAMITLALSQLFYLHRGLKLCSTSVLYPFVFCIYNIIAILDGLIYFRQMSLLTRFHAGLIALGTVFLLGGVLCLSWRLEDIESHTAVTVAGASQTGLGPGMAILEEHTEPPLDLEFGDDEERHAGEREPLLRAAHRPPPRGPVHQRTPSLPLHFSPLAHRDSADVDPASIWAELDDSDCDYSPTNPRPRAQTRAFTGSSHLRQGNKPSGAQTARDTSSRRARHFSLNQLTWTPPRMSSFAYGSTKPARRTPSPGSGTHQSQKRQSFPGNWTVPGYGSTQDTSRDDNNNNDDDLHSPGSRPNQPQSSASAPLAGPRSIVRGAWRSGMRYLARLTGGPGARSRSGQPHDPETDALQSNPH